MVVLRIYFPVQQKSVKIILTNDEKPEIVTNKKLMVEVGESRVISNRVLHVTDKDTEDSEILFKILETPTQGELIRSIPGTADEVLRQGDTFSEEQGLN